MLVAKTVWDGISDIVVVVDTDGGVWTPDATAQAEIHACSTRADGRKSKAVEICRTSPMRGKWSQ